MKDFKVEIFDFTVNRSIDKLEVLDKVGMINTINPHSYCVTKQDALFREALLCSDILIPDGTGIVWASLILAKQNLNRISGSDLHIHLLNKLNEIAGKAFYLGSSLQTLDKIEKRLNKEYPNVQFAGYSPPYVQIFSDENNRDMVKAINKFKPHVLFIGMTAPKQEKWAYRHKDVLETNIIASVGAVFDFYAGTVRRPGKFWRQLGLEWLPRLLREPVRLWRRNFISTPEFIIDVLKEKFKKA